MAGNNGYCLFSNVTPKSSQKKSSLFFTNEGMCGLKNSVHQVTCTHLQNCLTMHTFTMYVTVLLHNCVEWIGFWFVFYEWFDYQNPTNLEELDQSCWSNNLWGWISFDAWNWHRDNLWLFFYNAADFPLILWPLVLHIWFQEARYISLGRPCQDDGHELAFPVASVICKVT